MVRRVTKGGMVIRGTEIVSRGGSKGRVEKFLQTWWCPVLTEAVVQEVFDLSPVGGYRYEGVCLSTSALLEIADQ